MMRFFLFLVVAGLSGLPALAEEPLRVEFVTATEADQTFSVTLSGAIEAKNSVEMSFPQGGRITEISVDEGDPVKAGQVLARTDPQQQEQSLLVAKAGLAASQAAFEQASQAAERAAAMLKRGVGTRAARDAADQALSEAEGALERARASVDQAGRAVADTAIHAPSDGIVTARLAEPGQVVGGAQPVVSLAETSGLDAVFETPDVSNLDHAMGVAIALDPIDVDLPKMSGAITEISPMVNPQTGSVRVKATIDDVPPDAGLLGAAVRGTILIPGAQAISVPWTALTESGRDPAVWLVGTDGRAVLQTVRIKSFETDRVVLAGGLKPGQIIVGRGSQLLYPGRPVVDGAKP